MKKISANDLTAEEKLRLICGQDCWHTVSLGGKLPQIMVSDGPTGLRTEQTGEDGKTFTIPAVVYPSIQLLANTWSTECARVMGACLADDCLERNVDILLAPGVNIKRHPLNGRNFEYFSEDPVLAGQMAKAYIEGVQGGGVGVCLKHFCCNNLEYDRLHQSSDVDERPLHEIYYAPFAIACEAKPVSVMCSYNRVNGTYASEYKQGFDYLRNACGFDGAIFSDWDAVRDRASAARAGLDLEMPFNQGNYEKLCADYRAGKLPDTALDACAQRVIDLVCRCKEMRKDARVRTSEAERATEARQIAAEGMVLLKNDGTLPLERGSAVMVGGCYAKPDTPDMIRGGGSACVVRKDTFDLPARLAERGFSVRYEGAFRYDGVNSNVQNARTALEYAAESDVAIVCVGTGMPYEYEAGDRKTMRLQEVQERAIAEIAAQCERTVVVIFAGAAVEMSAWADKVQAIVFAGFPGAGGDEALADLLTGEIDPSGKLSETFPRALEDVPAARAFRCAGVTRYAEGLGVGYRYFDTYDVPVQFPFGYGLHYASYAYADLTYAPKGDGLEISYVVRNTSGRDGKEISQVYVRERAPLVYRPKKELKAFAKTFVCAGKSKTVTHFLDKSAFAHWSVSQNEWEVTDGIYEILVGASSADIRLRAKIRIRGGEIQII